MEHISNNSIYNSFPAKQFLNWCLLVISVGIILYVGQIIFIPLSFGLFISFILYPFCTWLEKKGVSKVSAILIGVLLITLLLTLIIFLLIRQFAAFEAEWPHLYKKLALTFSDLNNFLDQKWNISKAAQKAWLDQFIRNSAHDLLQLIRGFISVSVVSAILFIMIPIYTFLLLFYRHRFVVILENIVPTTIKSSLREILRLVIEAYSKFVKGMLIVYLVVGILNSIGLLLLDIPHAIFFGFAASILTFIPYVGIMAASLLPITVAWVTHTSILYPLGVVAVFAIVQSLEANVIFPWAVSQKLNLNTLIVITAIFAGAIIWGASGMILFIPFVAIAKLIAEHIPGGENVASLLRGNDKK